MLSRYEHRIQRNAVPSYMHHRSEPDLPTAVGQFRRNFYIESQVHDSLPFRHIPERCYDYRR